MRPTRSARADSPGTPATSRGLPEDLNWKLQAGCTSYKGPVMEVPIELCEPCPVRTECGALYAEMQADIDADRGPNEAKQYLGGIWEGEKKQSARHQVAFGSIPIEPCPDDCEAPRHARGACRNHYQQQYDRHTKRKR